MAQPGLAGETNLESVVFKISLEKDASTTFNIRSKKPSGSDFFSECVSDYRLVAPRSRVDEFVVRLDNRSLSDYHKKRRGVYRTADDACEDIQKVASRLFDESRLGNVGGTGGHVIHVATDRKSFQFRVSNLDDSRAIKRRCLRKTESLRLRSANSLEVEIDGQTDWSEDRWGWNGADEVCAEVVQLADRIVRGTSSAGGRCRQRGRWEESTSRIRSEDRHCPPGQTGSLSDIYEQYEVYECRRNRKIVVDTTWKFLRTQGNCYEGPRPICGARNLGDTWSGPNRGGSSTEACPGGHTGQVNITFTETDVIECTRRGPRVVDTVRSNIRRDRSLCRRDGSGDNPLSCDAGTQIMWRDKARSDTCQGTVDAIGRIGATAEVRGFEPRTHSSAQAQCVMVSKNQAQWRVIALSGICRPHDNR